MVFLVQTLKTKGPFADWPTSMIVEVCEAVYQTRAGNKHLMHLVIHPQLDNFCIRGRGSVYFVMRVLRERCAGNLRILSFRCLENIKIFNEILNKLSSKRSGKW